MAPFAPPVEAGDEAQPAPGNNLRLQILGPLRIWRDGVELAAGPRQQAYLLALLLARAGRPISLNELIDLIWDDDVPTSAVNVIQKYVGGLRRVLEPSLPVRDMGSYLRRRGSGYLFVAPAGVLDIVTFRQLVESAKRARAEHHDDLALDSYTDALKLWRGHAGDGLSHGSAASPIFTALDNEFFDACAAAAELAISSDQPQRVLPSLRLAASMGPLHEPVQAAVITVLAAAGQQAEALAVYGRVRARLAEDLGVEPGLTLRAAHQRVLARSQAPAVLAADTTAVTETAGAPMVGHVGRTEELGVLRRAVDSALTGGTGLVLVEGEPGVGKTRLLQEVAAEAGRRGALVVWGHCLLGEGAPVMWPWAQAIDTVLGTVPASERATWLGGELGRLVEPREDISGSLSLPDSAAQFRLFEQVAAVIGDAATARPVVFMIDDLQWADLASLQLFGHVAARLPNGAALLGALRDTAPAPSSELSRVLAAVSRMPGHRRVRLGALAPAEVSELVRREARQDPGPDVIRSIHARAGGNPFFVRELSRLLTEQGALTVDAAQRAGVPSTVRDIVRDRMARLAPDARDLLQVAALVGRNVDVGLLARAADLDIPSCFGRLESMQSLGLLEPTPGDPFSYRFAHDLVRESIVGTIPPPRVPRLHLGIADALDHIGPEGETAAERVAHHLWAAGPTAEPARTVRALVLAGRSAGTKFALEAAEQHQRSAVRIARGAGLAELELSALSQLTAIAGMQSGYVGSTLDLLERAERVALGLGREREATDFLFARRAAYSQAIELDRSGPLARRLLEQGEASSDPIVHAYGLHSWGIHQWDVGNIGEAFRYLSRSDRTMLDGLARREENRLRHDLQLLSPVMLALMTALHGDPAAARALLDTVEATAGDDPYVTIVWTTFASTIASLAGDPAWALRTADRGIAVDPTFSFAFFGTYQRLARQWALALTGHDAAQAAAEAERLITARLIDPPLSCVAAWYGLLGEIHLVAGAPTQAAAALDRADHYLEANGQRYAEGLILLLRARLLLALGKPVTVVQAAAERARSLSVEREAYLFVRRADEFLAGLEHC